ncbi:MAG TPA: hypothetical protein VFB67_05240 [Candidatus Polarisedimenticolaceae bacterium]|nr:hypothetical protein [Candidatus Polarisedimenticolaceae bacterium]
MRRHAVAILAIALALPAARAEEALTVRGSLAWIASDRLDLVGTMEARLPLARAGAWQVFASLSAVTAIEKARSDFTFLVDQVSYAGGVGALRPLPGRGAIELLVEERGLMLVDAAGRARVRVAGAGWRSSTLDDPFAAGWAGRVAAGGVFEERGVEASATVSGSIRYLHPFGDARAAAIGFEAEADALLGPDGGADLSIGPLLAFDLGGDRRFGLFARYLSGENPLGIGESGVLGGFDFAAGPPGTAPRPEPPEIGGLAGAGGGEDGRGFVRLALRIATPPFLAGLHAAIEVDGNVLTAEDRNDLFYLYDAGLARALSGWRAGVWFHHRSNHVLDGDNATVTSLNVLEAGIESAGWNRAEPGWALGRAGWLDLSARAGWLIDSAFGEDTWWQARGGLRLASPAIGASHVFVSAELERGDVGGSAYAAGALLPRGWEVRVEARHDEQWFAADRRVLLGIATLRY